MGYDERDKYIAPQVRYDAPIMHIGLGSDWHIGASSDKQIRRALNELKDKNPSILCLLGDFNGGWYGYKAVRSVIKLVREAFPDITILTVLGNHDFWVRGKRMTRDSIDMMMLGNGSYLKPSLAEWDRNYQEILKVFRDNKVHFLDEDGVWRDPRWPGVAIMGHTMWYDTQHPHTNDHRFMPVNIEGNTNAYMYMRAIRAVDKQADSLTDADHTRIFCSHMPVVYPKGKSHGDICYGGPERVGDMLKDSFNVRYFLNGHSHQHWEHHPRYEGGSDYGYPRSIIVPVYDESIDL